MLRLTVLLTISMVLALMIAGEDRGQLRPGLAKVAAEGPVPAAAALVPEVEVVVAKPEAKPVVEVVAAAAPSPAPYVEPVREVVQAVEEPVFTLSALPNEAVPGATEAQASRAEGQIYYVTASSVNVREAPSTEASILGKLGTGEAALVITDVDGEWARIVIQGDGMEGYVAMRFLSAEAP
jgi:uncharacterized protein YgiM (DUF1202 family)